jgi:hypothetical protein
MDTVPAAAEISCERDEMKERHCCSSLDRVRYVGREARGTWAVEALHAPHDLNNEHKQRSRCNHGWIN